MTSLPSVISSLSRAEKFELLDAIWADLETETEAELTEEQTAELGRRVFAYRRDPDAVISWDTIKADLRK